MNSVVSPYDDPEYDYQKYWLNRQYEDQCERWILRKFFSQIPDHNSILDLGSGYGRLTSEYARKFIHCYLIDASTKLLTQSQKYCNQFKNLTLKTGRLEKIPLPDDYLGVILCVRTLHHLDNLDQVFHEIKRVLKPNGWLILEFANKVRFKNTLRALFKLDFNYPTSHQPINLNISKKLAFYSFHPNQIKTLLGKYSLSIKGFVSVSNFRSPWLKKILPLKWLLAMEKKFVKLEKSIPALSYFGPSIFILAQKK